MLFYSWATRYPTNVDDVGRVLSQLAELSLTKRMLPNKVHFSSQKLYTKYSIARFFAELVGAGSDHLVQQSEGPGPNDTVRPRDCHLSNQELSNLGVDCSAVSFEDWWRAYVASGNGQK